MQARITRIDEYFTPTYKVKRKVEAKGGHLVDMRLKLCRMGKSCMRQWRGILLLRLILMHFLLIFTNW